MKFINNSPRKPSGL